jgi:multidrug efflux system outer membrane protein
MLVFHSLRRQKNKVILLLSSLVLSACAVGPDYNRPDVTLPAYVLGKNDIDHRREVDWWLHAGDRDLAALIDLVLTDNLSLKMAAARIDAAQAQVQLARAALFPTLGYTGSYSDTKEPSVFGPSPAMITGQLMPVLTWSPDFWGRTRRQIEAAEAMTRSQEEGFRAATVLMVGQVAATYVQLRSAEEQLDMTRKVLSRLRSELQEIRTAMPSAPISMMAPLEAVQVQLQASIPSLMGVVEESENTLRALCARPELRIRKGLGLSALRTPALPKAIPSELIRRRPDVIQAENVLIAQNAAVGVAIAAYFPQLTLNAGSGIGLSGLAAGTLPNATGTALTAAAGLTGPLFSGGAIEAGVSGAQAAKREALLNYRNSVIKGFLEARTAIVRYNYSGRAVAAYANALAANRKAAGHVKKDVKEDAAHIATMLTLQQQEFAQRQALIGARAAQFNALIQVYQSLGGPWIDVWAQRSLSANAPAIGQDGQ